MKGRREERYGGQIDTNLTIFPLSEGFFNAQKISVEVDDIEVAMRI